jgi:hypothetical protein
LCIFISFTYVYSVHSSLIWCCFEISSYFRFFFVNYFHIQINPNNDGPEHTHVFPWRNIIYTGRFFYSSRPHVYASVMHFFKFWFMRNLCVLLYYKTIAHRHRYFVSLKECPVVAVISNILFFKTFLKANNIILFIFLEFLI